jgi:hypothetical protein
MKGLWSSFWQSHRPPQTAQSRSELFQNRFNRTYQALSSASIETLWQTLTNLTDMSWHPLINSTNAPQGLIAKPGLIYRVRPRCVPIPISIFVERVSPQELLSIRLFPIPGLEERVIYQLKSTVWGTEISYSIALRGWLSPVVWSFLKPFAAQVAGAIARAAEGGNQPPLPGRKQHSEAG